MSMILSMGTLFNNLIENNFIELSNSVPIQERLAHPICAELMVVVSPGSPRDSIEEVDLHSTAFKQYDDHALGPAERRYPIPNHADNVHTAHAVYIAFVDAFAAFLRRNAALAENSLPEAHT